MTRLTTTIEYIFSDDNQLVLEIQVFRDHTKLDLSLAAFLQFLYQEQDSLDSKDADFCYTLAKLIKRINIQNKPRFAIKSEQEIHMFFEKAKEQNIPVHWKYRSKKKLITYNKPLPIHITVSQHQKDLICKFENHDQWMDDPLAWQSFAHDKKRIIFCQGRLSDRISASFEDFMCRFLDTPTQIFSKNEVDQFINTVYNPHKKAIIWRIFADFKSLVPQPTEPIPVLNITYEEPILTPKLSYQYGKRIITPEYTKTIVEERKKGRRYIRSSKLESIYQTDLMTLFEEHQLPFLLQSPGDIQTFMKVLVPKLIERNWLVSSDVPEFNIAPEEIELEFNVNSNTDSDTDWFYFEPNCEIDGQAFSLQEIARLIVQQDNGYLKTKSGYVKLSDKSVKELTFLGDEGAFKINQKYDKRSIIGLISSTNTHSSQASTHDLIRSLKKPSEAITCTPDASFSGTLRDYQEAGLRWMKFLQNNGFGGILADDMGLGKTVQTIAFCSQMKSEGPVLVVGPTNVIFNWQQEIKSFLPSAKTLVYAGGKRHQHIKHLLKYEFIVTSFGILKNDIEWLSSIPVKAIFIDEAQYMKNPQSQLSKAIKCLHAPFKCLMTGTPIENHLSDLWNLFDFILPDLLGSQRSFDTLVKSSSLTSFKTKISPFVLRRLKQNVLDSLPEKTEIVLKTALTKEQEALYKTILTAAKQGVKNMSGQKERMHVLTSLLKLRQVCIHPELLKELTLPMPSSKFDLVKEKVTELISEGHKIVFFSQFTGMLNIFETWLKQEHIETFRIDGSISGKNRQDVVNNFQKSTNPGICIISLKAGGVGINLTSADYVIHMDPWWNPAIEAQATDRVHRMGQKNKVIVYKFITEGTIEEKILSLQQQKSALLETMIDIEGAEDKKLDFDEIRNLLN